MIIIGHRGAAGYAPENTIAAFQKGLDIGCQMLEFDVRACKSGEVVVFHDATLERANSMADAVIEMSLQQLRATDLNISTLSETLSFIGNRAISCIELKEQGMAKAIAADLNKAADSGISWDNLYVISFFHNELLELRRLIPQLKIGPTLCGLPFDGARFAYDIKAHAVHPCIHFLDEAFVEDAHKHGLKIYPWTADNKLEIEKAWRLGVDGITSNFPDRVMQFRPTGK